MAYYNQKIPMIDMVIVVYDHFVKYINDKSNIVYMAMVKKMHAAGSPVMSW